MGRGKGLCVAVAAIIVSTGYVSRAKGDPSIARVVPYALTLMKNKGIPEMPDGRLLEIGRENANKVKSIPQCIGESLSLDPSPIFVIEPVAEGILCLEEYKARKGTLKGIENELLSLYGSATRQRTAAFFWRWMMNWTKEISVGSAENAEIDRFLNATEVAIQIADYSLDRIKSLKVPVANRSKRLSFFNRHLALLHYENGLFGKAASVFTQISIKDRSPCDHLGLRASEVMDSMSSSDEKKLRTLLHEFPGLRFKVRRVLRSLESQRVVSKLQRELENQEDDDTRLQLLASYLHNPLKTADFIQLLEESIRIYPNDDRFKCIEVRRVSQSGQNDRAAKLMENVSDPMADPYCRSFMLTQSTQPFLRFLQGGSRDEALKSAGMIKKLAGVIETTQPFESAVGRAISGFIETTIQSVVHDEKAGSTQPDLRNLDRNKTLRNARGALSQLNRWKDHVVLHRIEAILDLFEDRPISANDMRTLVDSMIKHVSSQETNSARILGAERLLMRFMKTGDTSLLKPALSILDESLDSNSKWLIRLLKDVNMELEDCPPSGCIDHTRTCVLRAGIRTLIRDQKGKSKSRAWDHETLSDLDRCLAPLRDFEDHKRPSSTLSEVSLRCFLEARSGTSKKTKACLDEWMRHSGDHALPWIHAAAFAADKGQPEAAILQFKEALGKNLGNKPARLKYEIWKWIFELARGQKDPSELVQQARKEAEVLVQEASSGLLASRIPDVLPSGSFNLGYGWNVKRDRNEALFQAVMTMSLQFVPMASIDDGNFPVP